MLCMYYIYKITNLINNKIYIGQTKNPDHRWRQHKNKAKNEKPDMVICQAMKKYGIDNFIYEIIACCKTQEDIDFTEELIIKQLDSCNSEKGYNIATGGKYLPKSEETKRKISRAHKNKVLSKKHKEKISEARKGRELSEEHKRKISESNSGKVFSEEHRQNLSKSRQGKPPPNKGKPMSEEQKKKISEAHKNRLSQRAKND